MVYSSFMNQNLPVFFIFLTFFLDLWTQLMIFIVLTNLRNISFFLHDKCECSFNQNMDVYLLYFPKWILLFIIWPTMG